MTAIEFEQDAAELSPAAARELAADHYGYAVSYAALATTTADADRAARYRKLADSHERTADLYASMAD